MKLSIIIPAYNEEHFIEEIIKRVKAVKLKMEKEIIVVDDGSTDPTYNVLKRIKGIKLVRHFTNLGKGRTIKTGLKYATGDYILIQDADLEYDPKDYPILLEPLIKKESDVVYGNRLPLYEGRKIYPNYLGCRLLAFVARILYGTAIIDTETGYKVFKSEIIKNIQFKATGFAADAEITARLLKKGYKIKEVPIHYKPRGYNEGKKVTLYDGFKSLFYLIKCRFFD